MRICPSAKEGVNVPAVIHEFCEKDFYRQDYLDITKYFTGDFVEFEKVIAEMIALADSGLFGEN